VDNVVTVMSFTLTLHAVDKLGDKPQTSAEVLEVAVDQVVLSHLYCKQAKGQYTYVYYKQVLN